MTEQTNEALKDYLGMIAKALDPVARAHRQGTREINKLTNEAFTKFTQYMGSLVGLPTGYQAKRIRQREPMTDLQKILSLPILSRFRRGTKQGETETKREIGERWTDKDGKEWEQKEGYKISVGQMDDVRDYLKKLTTCHSENCETGNYSYANKKAVARTGYCVTCLRKLEQDLRNDGTWQIGRAHV